MKTATLSILAATLLMATACNKQDTRGVKLEVVCQTCQLEYRDGTGALVQTTVNDKFTTNFPLEVGASLYAKVCSNNETPGGSFQHPQYLWGGALIHIALDGGVTADYNADTWESQLDSVQVPNLSTSDPDDLIWKYLVTDTCAVVDAVLTERAK
jgi:hypothetical protein